MDEGVDLPVQGRLQRAPLTTVCIRNVGGLTFLLICYCTSAKPVTAVVCPDQHWYV